MIRSLISSPLRTIVSRNLFPAAATATAAAPLPQKTRRFLDTDANQKVYDDFLSKLSPHRRKMFHILNDYRIKNFTQCTNARFLKTIISAVDLNKDNVISKEEYQTLLKNIGAEKQMSKEDMDAIFDELGVGDDKVIPVDFIKKSWEPLLQIVIPK
ncbi:hypothetical protein ACHAXM_007071 [Skeletonema potamos]